jgi:hypothetical protein
MSPGVATISVPPSLTAGVATDASGALAAAEAWGALATGPDGVATELPQAPNTSDAIASAAPTLSLVLVTLTRLLNYAPNWVCTAGPFCSADPAAAPVGSYGPAQPH